MNYQKLGKTLIYPLILRGEDEPSAFKQAECWYSEHSKKSFLEVLVDYHNNGFVISDPHFFAMGKPIVHPRFQEGDTRRGWFVEFMVGDLLEMLRRMPCPLDFIAFCRKGGENLRIVDLNALARHLTRKQRLCANQGAG